MPTRSPTSTFLERCTAETIRLEPSSPIALRRVVADTALGDGTTLRVGDTVTIDLLAANRDLSVWGDHAEAFDPYREAPEGVAPSGLSFGHGMHHCIGAELAAGATRRATGDDERLWGLVPIVGAVAVRQRLPGRPDAAPPEPDDVDGPALLRPLPRIARVSGGGAVIDVHAHVMLEARLGAAGESRPGIETAATAARVFRVGRLRLDGVDYRGTAFMDVDVAPRPHGRRRHRPPGAHAQPADLVPPPARPDAVAYCEAHNDALGRPRRRPPRPVVGAGPAAGAGPAGRRRRTGASASASACAAARSAPTPASPSTTRAGPRSGRGPRTSACRCSCTRLRRAPTGRPTNGCGRHGFDLHGGFCRRGDPRGRGADLRRRARTHPRPRRLCVATAAARRRCFSAARVAPWPLGRAGPATPPMSTAGCAGLWFDTHVGSDAAVAALVDGGRHRPAGARHQLRRLGRRRRRPARAGAGTPRRQRPTPVARITQARCRR